MYEVKVSLCFNRIKLIKVEKNKIKAMIHSSFFYGGPTTKNIFFYVCLPLLPLNETQFKKSILLIREDARKKCFFCVGETLRPCYNVPPPPPTP